MADQDYDIEDFRPDPPNKPDEVSWVTQSGERIMVEDMTDSHLVNVIRMLRRVAEVKRPLMAYATDCAAASFNGEMAQLDCEQQAAFLYRMDNDDFLQQTHPTWPALIAEAQRRGLEP